MNKIIAVVVVVIAACFLITPQIAGSKFNSTLDQLIQNTNDATPYSVSIASRESGWFSSKATIVVELSMQDFAAGPPADSEQNISDFNLEIDLAADHGPLLNADGVKLGWIEWVLSIAKPESDSDFVVQSEVPYVYQVKGIMGLGQEIVISDKLPAMVITNTAQEKDVTIKVAEYIGRSLVNSGGFSYQTESAGMVDILQDGQSVFVAEGIEITSLLKGNLFQIMQNGLYDGLSVISIQSATANLENGMPLFLATDFTMDVESVLKEEAGLGEIAIAYGFERLDFDNYAVTDAEVAMRINNLSVDFINAYNDLNQQMLEAPEQMPELLNAFLQTSLLGQLQKDPEFNISNLQFSLDGSQLKGYANSGLSGVTALPDTFENPAFWLQHGNVDSQFTIEQIIAEELSIVYLLDQMKQNGMEENRELAAQQAPIMLDSLVQQGLLTLIDGGFSMSVSLIDGKLLLNGNAIPL